MKNTWRRSALHALNRKRTEYRFLKQWVKDRESDLTRTDLAGAGIDAQDDWAVTAHAASSWARSSSLKAILLWTFWTSSRPRNAVVP